MGATVYPVDCDVNVTGDKDDNAIREDANSRDGYLPLANLSLGVFPLQSAFRQRIIRFVSPSSSFDSFILAMIGLNSVLMACVDYRYVDEQYNPSSELSARNQIVENAEKFFLVLFILEVILKVVAHGFVLGRKTYLRNHWNQFDFFVVVIRWVRSERSSFAAAIKAIPHRLLSDCAFCFIFGRDLASWA